MNKTLSSLAILMAFSSASVCAHAQSVLKDGYGQPVTSSTPGLCWSVGSSAPGQCTPAVKKDIVVRTGVMKPVLKPAVQLAPAPAVQRVVLHSSQTFGFNSARLNAAGYNLVTEQAWRVLKMNGPTGEPLVQVTGYTDSLGSAAYNHRLALKRAQAVEQQLVENGVPRDNILVHAVGADDFVVAPSSCHGSLRARIACQAPNRRVVIEIDHP